MLGWLVRSQDGRSMPTEGTMAPCMQAHIRFGSIFTTLGVEPQQGEPVRIREGKAIKNMSTTQYTSSPSSSWSGGRHA